MWPLRNQPTRPSRTIVEKDGRLDVVIHNAGHMVFGAAEAFTPEQLLAGL